MLDRWVPLMLYMMDLTGDKNQPRQNASAYNAVFMVAFVFVGAIFMLKLFVAVIIDTYNQAFSSSQGSGPKRLGDVGADSHDAKLEAAGAAACDDPRGQPMTPCGRCATTWWSTGTSEPFTYGHSTRCTTFAATDNFLLCIAVNLGFMCTRHHGQSEAGDVVHYQDIVFLSILPSSGPEMPRAPAVPLLQGQLAVLRRPCRYRGHRGMAVHRRGRRRRQPRTASPACAALSTRASSSSS